MIVISVLFWGKCKLLTYMLFLKKSHLLTLCHHPPTVGTMRSRHKVKVWSETLGVVQDTPWGPRAPELIVSDRHQPHGSNFLHDITQTHSFSLKRSLNLGSSEGQWDPPVIKYIQPLTLSAAEWDNTDGYSLQPCMTPHTSCLRKREMFLIRKGPYVAEGASLSCLSICSIRAKFPLIRRTSSHNSWNGKHEKYLACVGVSNLLFFGAFQVLICI